MKAPLSWLRDFAPIEGSPVRPGRPAQRDRPHRRGHRRPGRATSPASRTVKVLAVEKHPDADRLALVDVDPGDGNAVRVVCGAHNYVVGDIVPWAPPGAELPGGFKLERRKIRGAGVRRDALRPRRARPVRRPQRDHDPPARHAARARTSAPSCGLDDIVFDLEITPNRPDAMSIAGVARDLAAALGVPFTLPAPAGRAGRSRSRRRHAGGRGARPLPPLRGPDRARWPSAPSPGWMAQRLDQGRHAADLQRGRRHQLRDAGTGPAPPRLRPRPARRAGHRRPPGRRRREDHHPRRGGAHPRRRRPPDLRRQPGAPGHRRRHGRRRLRGLRRHHRAPAGVGLLHAATGILRTSKRLGLRTESSRPLRAGRRPQRHRPRRRPGLGAVRRDRLRTGRQRRPRRLPDPRSSRPGSRCGRPGSTRSSAPTSTRRRSGATWSRWASPPATPATARSTYTVPTYRPDCEREIDLIEEVARHHGYNNIARTLPRTKEPSRRPHADPAGPAHGARRPGRRRPVRGLHVLARVGRRPGRRRPARRGHRAGEPAAGRGVAAAPGGAARPAQGGGVQRRPRPARRRPVRGRPRLPAPARRADPARRAGAPRRRGGRHGLPAAPRAEPARRRPRRRRPAGDRGRGAGAGRLVAPTGRRPRLRPRAGGRASSSTATTVGAVGEIDPAVARPASAWPAPWPPSRSTCPGSSTATRQERRSVTPSRFPASTIDLAFVLDEPVPAGAAQRTPARRRRRPAGGRPALRRLPLRRPRPDQEEPGLRACASGRPTAP